MLTLILRFQTSAHSAKFRLQLEGSQSGVSVNSPCSTSSFHCWIIYYFTLPLLLSGFTTTSSMRTVSQCTLGTELQSFITTKPFLPGFGSTGRTPVVWPLASLPRPRFYWVSCFFKLLRGEFSFLFTGVHSVDFSGVRDDKCHTGVGQSRVILKFPTN